MRRRLIEWTEALAARGYSLLGDLEAGAGADYPAKPFTTMPKKKAAHTKATSFQFMRMG